jgi:hypothetical protein
VAPLGAGGGLGARGFGQQGTLGGLERAEGGAMGAAAAATGSCQEIKGFSLSACTKEGSGPEHRMNESVHCVPAAYAQAPTLPCRVYPAVASWIVLLC